MRKYLEFDDAEISDDKLDRLLALADGKFVLIEQFDPFIEIWFFDNTDSRIIERIQVMTMSIRSMHIRMSEFFMQRGIPCATRYPSRWTHEFISTKYNFYALMNDEEAIHYLLQSSFDLKLKEKCPDDDLKSGRRSLWTTVTE